MGDLANMTSVHGEVNGFRLLRWLRSKAAVEREDEKGCGELYCVRLQHWHRGRADLLTEMSDDLERELTQPDYPGDDGEEGEGEVSSTLAPCPGCGELYDCGVNSGGACTVCLRLTKPVANDDTVDLDDPALGGTRPPCPVCGGSVVRGPQDADDLCVRCSPNP